MKYPGAEVAIWTIIWMIAGTVVAVTTFQRGSIALGVFFAALPVACALVWLDIREAKWLIFAYFGIAVLGGLLLLFTRGFNWLAVMRIIVAAYFVFVMARWQGGPSADEPCRFSSLGSGGDFGYSLPMIRSCSSITTIVAGATQRLMRTGFPMWSHAQGCCVAHKV